MLSNAERQAQQKMQAKKTRRPIYSGRLITVETLSYHFPGKEVTVDIVSHPGVVAILAIDDQGQLLLVRQFRNAIERILIELPAGCLKPCEKAIACAQRELQEETGYRAAVLSHLTDLHSCPGFCNEVIHLFLAKGLSFDPLPPDEDEALDVLRLTPQQAIAMVHSGDITDAKTIAALFFYLTLPCEQKETL
ncbi:MAG: NUDIX hydrolase [Chlamydiae bacterium]|nr:NUDIX hydrolase [Chlamydiota bacterium]